jgi:hypothetical protein
MALRGLATRHRQCATSPAAAGVAPGPGRHAGAGRHAAAPRECRRRWVARAGVDDDAEWEKEMSIFKQRTMRPNQLETLRELEAKVNVGKVGAALEHGAR